MTAQSNDRSTPSLNAISDGNLSSSSTGSASEPSGRTLTGSEILWESMIKEGVEVLFGYPGGAIMPAYDALPKYPMLHHVLVRHEQGAAHMADGYARASGRVGVAVATSGPGATNLTTGIANAMLDSIPVVFITGQVASPLLGSDAFQETDITGVTLPITKHNFLVTRAEDIEQAIREAFYIARTGRPGPVVVDITKDALIKTAMISEQPRPVRLPGHPTLRRPNQSRLMEAVSLIRRAQRPIVFAGQGIIQGEATSLLLEFIKKTDIPVASTLLGLGGFPASHPRALGMMGMHGEAWVNQAIQASDLILALGMRFDDRVTGNLRTYAPHAKKIHVELDPAEINKNVPVDLALVGDVKEILQNLTPLVDSVTPREWLDQIEQWKQKASELDIQQMPDQGRLHTAHVIHDIWQLTAGNSVVVSDVGQHQMWEAQYYRHDRPRTLITSGGLGTMGFALPAAIGARFARPNEEVWVIAGDGGFQMTQAELQTIAQERVKLNIAIMNNGYLGMVRQWQQFFFDRRYVATPITSPDFVKIAEAHGLMGLRVTERSQIREAVEKARAAPTTVLIDFRVEPEESVYPMVATGADLDDMIRRPRPNPSNQGPTSVDPAQKG